MPMSCPSSSPTSPTPCTCYVTQLKKLGYEERDKAKERDKEIYRRRLQGAQRPQENHGSPAVEAHPALSQLRPARSGLRRPDRGRADGTTRRYSAAAAANLAPGVNEDLIAASVCLLDSRGLPNRPWFQHLLYAPGFYTGYGVKTIPGVREAIEQKQWASVDPQIQRVANALEREATLLENATKTLQAK